MNFITLLFKKNNPYIPSNENVIITNNKDINNKNINDKKLISYKKTQKVLFDIFDITKSLDFHIEHIIPRSIFHCNKLILNDMHNLIIYPKKLNLHRSNYKYVSDSKIYEDTIIVNLSGIKIDYNKPFGDTVGLKNNKRKIFNPPSIYRGQIARASMYFIQEYPIYENIILRNVIDIYNILTWHHQYPVTEFEKKKNQIIRDQQGNYNKYISNPELLVKDVEVILGIKLDIFEHYRY